MEFRVVCDFEGALQGFAGARAKVRQSSHRCVQCGTAVRGDVETNVGLSFLLRDGKINLHVAPDDGYPRADTVIQQTVEGLVEISEDLGKMRRIRA